MPLPAIVTGALITGGASLLGGIFGNKQRADIADSTNALTREQFNTGLDFNREQSELMRSFNERMMYETFGFNSQEALMQRQFSAQQAQINRDWMTKMSNTQHQRQVKDLKAAGLNPILSANSGAGVPASPSAAGAAAAAQAASSAMASAPSGGNYQQAQYIDPVGSAVDAASQFTQIGKTRAEITEIGEKTNNLIKDLDIKDHQVKKLIEEANQVLASARKMSAETDGINMENAAKKAATAYLANNEKAALLDRMGVAKWQWLQFVEGVAQIEELANSTGTLGWQGETNAKDAGHLQFKGWD